MTQRAVSTAHPSSVKASSYEDMPLGQILFRFMWPFWLLRNASVGDRFARSAAYLHNRRMRIYLPGYLLKWLCNSVVAFALTAAFGSSSTHASGLTSVIAAGAGVLFAGATIVLFTTGYIYLYLCRNDQ